MSSGAENLTQAIKDNLTAKTNRFFERSVADRDKIFIFTDNASLWKQGENVLCLTKEPLPPIPAGYDRNPSYDILEEIRVFIGVQVRPYKRIQEVYWSLYNSGEVDKPQVHILLSTDPNLESLASSLLQYDGKVPEIPPRSSLPVPTTANRRSTRWRHLSTVDEEYDLVVPDITLQQPTPNQSMDSPDD